MAIITRWKDSAVAARGRRYTPIQCAQAASVSMGQLMKELRDDPEFKQAYDVAFENAPQRVQW